MVGDGGILWNIVECCGRLWEMVGDLRVEEQRRGEAQPLAAADRIDVARSQPRVEAVERGDLRAVERRGGHALRLLTPRDVRRDPHARAVANVGCVHAARRRRVEAVHGVVCVDTRTLPAARQPAARADHRARAVLSARRRAAHAPEHSRQPETRLERLGLVLSDSEPAAGGSQIEFARYIGRRIPQDALDAARTVAKSKWWLVLAQLLHRRVRCPGGGRAKPRDGERKERGAIGSR